MNLFLSVRLICQNIIQFFLIVCKLERLLYQNITSKGFEVKQKNKCLVKRYITKKNNIKKGNWVKILGQYLSIYSSQKELMGGQNWAK
jgi:hypothetical protein